LAEGETKLTGPDLAKGIPLESLPDGQMLVGHAHGKAVWCGRQGTTDVCSWHLADIKVELRMSPQGVSGHPAFAI
jgi:hypothetical protein